MPATATYSTRMRSCSTSRRPAARPAASARPSSRRCGRGGDASCGATRTTTPASGTVPTSCCRSTSAPPRAEPLLELGGQRAPLAPAREPQRLAEVGPPSDAVPHPGPQAADHGGGLGIDEVRSAARRPAELEQGLEHHRPPVRRDDALDRVPARPAERLVVEEPAP